MIINQNSCDKCGKCAAECPKTAIVKDNGGNYSIESGLCDDCADYFDIECIRVCEKNAITMNDGTVKTFDPTWRLRSEHLIWAMAVMGSRGGDYFKGKHWDAFRRLISAAYLNPDLLVRMTHTFDDNCTGCALKQNPDHITMIRKLDDLCFLKLGVKPGLIIKFWDVVRLAEEKFTIGFLRELEVISEEVIAFYVSSLSSHIINE